MLSIGVRNWCVCSACASVPDTYAQGMHLFLMLVLSLFYSKGIALCACISTWCVCSVHPPVPVVDLTGCYSHHYSHFFFSQNNGEFCKIGHPSPTQTPLVIKNFCRIKEFVLVSIFNIQYWSKILTDCSQLYGLQSVKFSDWLIYSFFLIRSRVNSSKWDFVSLLAALRSFHLMAPLLRKSRFAQERWAIDRFERAMCPPFGLMWSTPPHWTWPIRSRPIISWILDC